MRSEEEVLGFWDRKKIFAKSVAGRKRAKRFVFFEGPPYSNGKPGLHHVEARAFKDVMARYKTMRGFLVERRAGWDTHGLPTEIAAEKKLGVKNKRDIEEKIGVRKFVEAAREDVYAYKSEWERMTRRMGYWIDLANAYVTMTNNYMESLWWIVKEFWDKKLLFEDDKTVPWCPRCGTALSSHELAQGYKSVSDPSIYVRFRLKTRRASLLVWTTTPWTLPANVAVAVHPDLDYVTVEERGEKFILLGELAEKLFPGSRQLWHEKGESLTGLEYEAPYPVAGTPYKVVAGDFISSGEGTGIVHIAPCFGEDDARVGKKNNLPFVCSVDDEGKFTGENSPFGGEFVKNADPKIINDLKQKGFLWKTESYAHDYPFCWRCDSPVIYMARKSWWVKVSSQRRQLADANKKINWYPPYLKEGRFGQWVADAKDWAFSRDRYWGTPLPIWKCDDCGIVDVFGSISELSGRVKTSGTAYYLIRHGFAKSNYLEVGVSDPKGDTYGLMPNGRKQVKKAANALKKQRIDVIVSSDLLRTRETAEIISKELKIPVVYDADLREVQLGDFDRKKSSYEFTQRMHELGHFDDKYPGKGGESMNDVKRRMFRVYKKFEELYHGKRVLVVSHGTPLRFFEGIAKGILNADAIPKVREFKNAQHKKVISAAVPRNDKGEVDLHKPYIDEVDVLCSRCLKVMKREPSVIDVWFDSGSMPYASWHYPFENKERIDKKISYPADYISEAIDQTRGWFYLLLVVSVLLGRGNPFRNVLSLGHVLDKKGKKMSKSRGNTVDPFELFEKFGADAVRWYFFTVNQPQDEKRFDVFDVQKAKRNFLDLFANSVRFYNMYKKYEKKSEKPHMLDRWILARLADARNGVASKMDKFDIVGAARTLEDFVANDISRWYVRRSRDRMKNGDGISTLRDVLLATSVMMAPFAPFMADGAYAELGGKAVSVHLETWPAKVSVSKKLLRDMADVRDKAARALELRSRAGIKVRQPLQKLSVRNAAFKDKEFYDILRDELNVKEIVVSKKLEEDIVLDTKLTDELKKEGTARDIIRALQDMRKKAELHPGDYIAASIDGGDFSGYEAKIIEGARIKRLTSADDLPSPHLEERVTFNDVRYVLRIAKV